MHTLPLSAWESHLIQGINRINLCKAHKILCRLHAMTLCPAYLIAATTGKSCLASAARWFGITRKGKLRATLEGRSFSRAVRPLPSAHPKQSLHPPPHTSSCLALSIIRPSSPHDHPRPLVSSLIRVPVAATCKSPS